MIYAEQRIAAENVRIRRHVLLPDNAVGRVLVEEGQRVDVREAVARGIIPNRHIILDALDILKINSEDELNDLMMVEPNVQLKADMPIAGRDPERGRRVLAPVDGVVQRVDNGRIIFQELPKVVSLEAGVRGVVQRVYPERGVSIESTGTVVQGVWGNGRSTIATLRTEPHGGIDVMQFDELDTAYRGEIVLLNRPITEGVLRVVNERPLGGIIAPSIPSSLREEAMNLSAAIMITEGFGDFKMPQNVYTLLDEFDGTQITLEAYFPRNWEPRRPEVVITRQSSDKPQDPTAQRTLLREGNRVRVLCEPHAGQAGRIVEVLSSPVLLENGLRAACARVNLMTGENVLVPIVDLELGGT